MAVGGKFYFSRFKQASSLSPVSRIKSLAASLMAVFSIFVRAPVGSSMGFPPIAHPRFVARFSAGERRFCIAEN
jgi:hypothetical protein